MAMTQTQTDRQGARIHGIGWSKIGIWLVLPVATWSAIVASLWWAL